MNKKVCTKCGKKVKRGQNFCPSCGESIEYDGEILEKKHFSAKVKIVSAISIIVVIGLIVGSVIWFNRCEHDYTDATCSKLATCKKCGNTKGKLLEHKWMEATCEKPATCSVCNATEGDPTEHKWLEATCEEPEKCSVCNETKGNPLGHEWDEATCTEPKTCKRCSNKEGKELGHKVEGQTCTEDGKCERCGEISKAVGHKWKEATCTTAKKCEVCGLEEGSALGHSGDEVCSRCGITDKSVAIANAKNSIFVYGIDLDMNSVGGVDTTITWKNMASKEIKYIDFSVQYYNNVKDIISDEISGKTTTVLSSTGPFPYGKGNYDCYASSSDGTADGYYFKIWSGYEEDCENGWADKYWEAPFYNTTTKYIKISKVDIEYMDGSKYTISDPDAISAMVGDGKHLNSWSTNDPGDNYLR